MSTILCVACVLEFSMSWWGGRKTYFFFRQGFRGLLQITKLEARDLPSLDLAGFKGPWTLRPSKYSTTSVRSTLNKHMIDEKAHETIVLTEGFQIGQNAYIRPSVHWVISVQSGEGRYPVILRRKFGVLGPFQQSEHPHCALTTIATWHVRPCGPCVSKSSAMVLCPCLHYLLSIATLSLSPLKFFTSSCLRSHVILAWARSGSCSWTHIIRKDNARHVKL